MCGIVGIVGAREPVEPRVLALMRDRLVHRGPDDSGLAFSRDGRTGFGHRRLSIIDPSPAGHQPMWNRSGTLVTTLQRRDLQLPRAGPELSGHGYSFATRSDTEVLLAAFEHWGLDAVEHLRGMFAFAIWSEAMRECVLVRDRLGVKPLYYAVVDGALYFASEATALHAAPEVAKALAPEAMGDFLAYGYVPGERSIWGGIRKLLPGHLMVFGPNGPLIRRYWTPPSAPDPDLGRDPGGAPDRARGGGRAGHGVGCADRRLPLRWPRFLDRGGAHGRHRGGSALLHGRLREREPGGGRRAGGGGALPHPAP